MKHKYTAKIHLEDGEVVVTSGDDVDQLMTWLNEQADGSFGELRGEIIENATGKAVKGFYYIPPELE